MTNLSQQLCKICGIEPKVNCANCSHPCEAACNNCNYGELTYPDFEQPANFVRLFNLITTIEGYVYRRGFYYIKYIPTYKQLSCLSTDEGEYSSGNTDPVKAFITCVIKCARAEKDTADYIREATWEV